MLAATLLTSACVAVEKFPGTAQCLSEGTLFAVCFLARVNSAGRSTAPGPRPKHALFQQCKLLEAPRELFGLLCHECFREAFDLKASEVSAGALHLDISSLQIRARA